MMNATSPAANTCPIARHATIAVAISTLARIFRATNNDSTASRRIGTPQINTVTNAGFHQTTRPPPWHPCPVSRKLASRHKPPTARKGPVSSLPQTRSSQAPKPFSGSCPSFSACTAKLQQLPISSSSIHTHTRMGILIFLTNH